MFVHFKTTTLIAISIFVSATITTVSTQTIQGGKKISPDLFGLFFEDINYSADGGLYAEMVQNRSFEYNPTERREWTPFSYWEYISPGFSYGRISVETTSSLYPTNPNYIVLDIEHVGKEAKHIGDAGVGIKNTGFDGMVVREGEKYNFSLFARQLSNSPVSLKVSLQNRRGNILAESTFSTTSGDWKSILQVLPRQKVTTPPTWLF
jgi:alpha-N-arabinofuranosidase